MTSDTATSTATVDALALLALPSLDALSEAQVRGKACVWDGVILSAETAVDLGPRRKKRLGNQYDWFPRGCWRCTGEAALPALHEHVLVCEQCVDNVGNCATGMALLRLIRDGHRAAAIIDQLAAPIVPCEPCFRAKLTGLPSNHGCTGVAALADGQACPCCPKAEAQTPPVPRADEPMREG